MEEKNLDFNFFIGMFLIFGLLMWFNINQPRELENNIDEVTKENFKHESESEIDVQYNRKEEKITNKNQPLFSELKTFSLSNNKLDVQISNYGAAINKVIIKDYLTYDSLSLELIKDLDFNFSFFFKDRIVNSNQLVFKQISESEHRISLTYEDESSNKITFIYELIPDSYNLKFNVITDNGNTYIEPNKMRFTQRINQLEKNLNNERNVTTINYSFNNTSSKQISLMKDVEKVIQNPVWIAHKQQFFSTIIASKDAFNETVISTESPSSNDYVKQLNSEFSIDYDNKNNNYAFDFYFVPNKYSLLKSFEQGFESLVPLGKFVFGWVNKFLVIPMFNFLENLGFNYGLIIFIIAVVIKVLLFLPTKSSYLSMAKMRVLKPEIDSINEKIKDPMQRQQAQMKLYSKTGVNPLGGCLPLLFQMPILIALFRFFPASIELRQQPFLWADDLSTYDSILDFGFSIPLYGDHISLFALLMTLATLLQMMYSNQMTSNTQMPQMKYIMYFMPVIFLLVMNNYSAALSYYYFLANIITFLQHAIIRRGIDEVALYKKLQDNKKKPIQKSAFQKKLEEMAKKNKR